MKRSSYLFAWCVEMVTKELKKSNSNDIVQGKLTFKLSPGKH
jgi:hypothetical protein